MENMLIKKEYKAIDVFKFICAALVVAIHTFKAEENSDGFYFAVMHVTSVAVPFFFACTGFFLFKKFEFDEKFRIKKTKENFIILIKFEKKIILSYLIWSFFYFLIKFAMAFANGKEEAVEYLKELPFNFFLNGTELHLWYVLCIIYAVPIIYFICRRLSVRYLIVIAFIFYAAGLLSKNYIWLDIGINKYLAQLSDTLGYGFAVFSRAIPFLSVGILWAVKNYNISKEVCLLGAVGFFTLQFVEKYILYRYCNTDLNARYFLLLPVTTFFVFGALMKYETDTAANAVVLRMRKISAFVYYFHPAVVTVATKLVKTLLSGAPVYGRFPFFLIVLVVSVTAGIIVQSLSGKIKLLKYLM